MGRANMAGAAGAVPGESAGASRPKVKMRKKRFAQAGE